MDIGQIGTHTTLNQGQPATDKNKLGQDKFLQLLVAQMQNQDPINPMDGKEFASQLAQFNSVEQLIGINNQLTSLQSSQEMMRLEMTNSMATSLAGKQVRALSNQIHLMAGGNSEINYELESPADEVEIVIQDTSGREVRREILKGSASGENKWTWDGKSSEGRAVPEGPYKVEVNASSGDSKVQSHIFTEGTANKVRFTGKGVFIAVNGIEVPIGNVESVATN